MAKANNEIIRREIAELIAADVSVRIDGCIYKPGKGEKLIRENSAYMKEFIKNGNDELVEVDYHSF